MRAILTVIGQDKVGIIARVTSYLESIGANVEDISQTLLQEYFTMIMLVDLRHTTLAAAEINAELDALGKDLGVSIRMQREEIFQAMHRI